MIKGKKILETIKKILVDILTPIIHPIIHLIRHIFIVFFYFIALRGLLILGEIIFSNDNPWNTTFEFITLVWFFTVFLIYAIEDVFTHVKNVIKGKSDRIK